MNISDNISTEDLDGNITGNASGKVVLSDGLLVPVGIVMVLENIISIILLWKCTRLLFQIRILSLNLALSDLFTGIFLSIPNTLFFEKYQCDIKKYPCFLFINVSLLIVTMMNLDRCFVFAFAMRYYSFITKKLIIKLSVLSWILGSFLTYGMFFGYDYGNGLSCELMAFLTRNTINTIFRCTLIGLVFLNLVMFGYLLHHIRKGFRKVHHTKTVQFSQRETRTVRKISVFTGMFLAAFSPFMIIYTFPILDLTSSMEKIIYTFSATLVLLNSACNPVLYVWRFSEPRYRIKNYFVSGIKRRLCQLTRNIANRQLLIVFIPFKSDKNTIFTIFSICERLTKYKLCFNV